MKKKIISYINYQRKRIVWQNKLGQDKKLHKFAKKFYSKIDKNNYTYLFSWNGEPLLQTPEDLIVLQEIISQAKPDVVVELGVAWGGSLLFLDSLAKIFPIKKIVGIDIFMPKDLKNRIKKKISTKVTMIENDTCSDFVINYLLNLKKKFKKFLIHLDSNHTHEHVLKELNIYSKFLSKGDYLIVGDTIIDYIPKQQHRIREWKKGNSPKSALDKFLKNKKNQNYFEVDKFISYKQMLTNNPFGYLKKIRN